MNFRRPKTRIAEHLFREIPCSEEVFDGNLVYRTYDKYVVISELSKGKEYDADYLYDLEKERFIHKKEIRKRDSRIENILKVMTTILYNSSWTTSPETYLSNYYKKLLFYIDTNKKSIMFFDIALNFMRAANKLLAYYSEEDVEDMLLEIGFVSEIKEIETISNKCFSRQLTTEEYDRITYNIKVVEQNKNFETIKTLIASVKARTIINNEMKDKIERMVVEKGLANILEVTALVERALMEVDGGLG